MRLIVDIGNSNVVVGLQQNANWLHIWRFKTDKHAKALSYGVKLLNALWEAGVSVDDIKIKILSTVVPELRDEFIKMLENLNDAPLLLLNKKLYSSLNITITAKEEIGTDLVANALAIHNIYKTGAIVVDYGTALTFMLIDAEGKILGVNIAPGIKTAMNSLSDKTSQLDNVPLILPENPLGKDTETAIQNGVLLGYIGLISYMISQIKNAYGKNVKVIATGGLVNVLKHKLPEIDIIAPNLTLDGLALLPQFVKV